LRPLQPLLARAGRARVSILIIFVVDFDNRQRLAPTRRKQRHVVIVNNRLSWAPASQMQPEPDHNHALAVGLMRRKEFQ
jgi:hypothetical protein